MQYIPQKNIKSAIVITHYKRLLDYIVPDIVHVLKDEIGRAHV